MEDQEHSDLPVEEETLQDGECRLEHFKELKMKCTTNQCLAWRPNSIVAGFQYFNINNPENTIGRSSDCNIVLNDSSVLAQHATIYREENGHYIVADDQLNTVKLHLRRQIWCRHQYVLKPGTRFTLGEEQTFEVESISIQQCPTSARSHTSSFKQTDSGVFQRQPAASFALANELKAVLNSRTSRADTGASEASINARNLSRKFEGLTEDENLHQENSIKSSSASEKLRIHGINEAKSDQNDSGMERKRKIKFSCARYLLVPWGEQSVNPELTAPPKPRLAIEEFDETGEYSHYRGEILHDTSFGYQESVRGKFLELEEGVDTKDPEFWNEEDGAEIKWIGKLCLKQIYPESLQRTIEVSSQIATPFRIGRKHTEDLVLNDNDVADSHVEIRFSEISGEFTLRVITKDSIYDTLVHLNGDSSIPVEERKVKIVVGDALEIGNARCWVLDINQAGMLHFEEKWHRLGLKISTIRASQHSDLIVRKSVDPMNDKPYKFRHRNTGVMLELDPKYFLFDQDDYLFGRSHECDVDINDLALAAQHCMIYFHNDHFFIESVTNKRNKGAYLLLGRKGDTPKDPFQLSEGTIFKVGNSEFEVTRIKVEDNPTKRSTNRARGSVAVRRQGHNPAGPQLIRRMSSFRSTQMSLSEETSTLPGGKLSLGSIRFRGSNLSAINSKRSSISGSMKRHSVTGLGSGKRRSTIIQKDDGDDMLLDTIDPLGMKINDDSPRMATKRQSIVRNTNHVSPRLDPEFLREATPEELWESDPACLKNGELPLESEEFLSKPYFIVFRSTAGPRRKTEFGIESDVCTLGSDPMATIYLNDSSVDKFNTIIQYTDGAWWLSDLESMHGTFLRIREDAYELQMGDTFRIGYTDLVVFGDTDILEARESCNACCSVS